MTDQTPVSETVIIRYRIVPGDILFRLRDTHGLPLVFALDFVSKRPGNWTIDWGSYMDAALDVWTFEKIQAELDGALREFGVRGQPLEQFLESARLYLLWYDAGKQPPLPRLPGWEQAVLASDIQCAPGQLSNAVV